MTTTISTIINDIRLKYFELKESFHLEKEKCAGKDVEISLLNQHVEELNQKLINLKKQLDDVLVSNQELELLLGEANSRVLESSSNRNSEIEIDFLVNEIDQCIQQIKTNL